MRFPRNLKVGKVDRYEVKIDSEWLGGESITSCPVVALNANVTIGAVSISGGSIYFMVTGAAAGSCELSLDLATSGGRTDCKHVTIVTEAC